jgi:hypothetical protein
MPPLRFYLPFLVFAAAGVISPGADAGAVDFRRDIEPLLAERCYKCHGTEKQKGGLRLDNKSDAFKRSDSGDFAIVPGTRRRAR